MKSLTLLVIVALVGLASAHPPPYIRSHAYQAANNKAMVQNMLTAMIKKYQEKVTSEKAMNQLLVKKHLKGEIAHEQMPQGDKMQRIGSIQSKLMAQKQYSSFHDKEKSTANEMTADQALLQLMEMLANDKAKEQAPCCVCFVAPCPCQCRGK